jgi:hypothetical protein
MDHSKSDAVAPNIEAWKSADLIFPMLEARY